MCCNLFLNTVDLEILVRFNFREEDKFANLEISGNLLL